jgi:hypothetical protein
VEEDRTETGEEKAKDVNMSASNSDNTASLRDNGGAIKKWFSQLKVTVLECKGKTLIIYSRNSTE